MDHPIVGLAAWVRDLHKSGIQIQAQAGARLSTWLVLGNAGALVIAFNAVVAGTSCDVGGLRTVLTNLVIGLISAFAAAAVNYGASVYSGVLTTRNVRNTNAIETHVFDVERLEARTGQATSADHPAKVAINALLTAELLLAEKMECVRWGIAASFFFALVSCGYFAAALLVPVLDNGHLIQTCAGEKNLSAPSKPES